MPSLFSQSCKLKRAALRPFRKSKNSRIMPIFIFLREKWCGSSCVDMPCAPKRAKPCARSGSDCGWVRGWNKTPPLCPLPFSYILGRDKGSKERQKSKEEHTIRIFSILRIFFFFDRSIEQPVFFILLPFFLLLHPPLLLSLSTLLYLYLTNMCPAF